MKILGDTDVEANRNYIRHFVLDTDSQYLRGVPSDKEAGKAHQLEWAEPFHYFGAETSTLSKYIDENAIKR